MEKLKKILKIALLSTVLLVFAVYFVTPVKAEPPLTTVLNELGFTNIQEIMNERDFTFPAGTYNVTLYAEFAAYHRGNNLSYYEVGKTTYYLIFDSPEGNFGYIQPPITKIVVISYTFGLSMCTPENHRYFTQNSLNPDGQRHSKVYKNNDDPSMYLIGFENLYGAGDRDYQDMVLSLRCLGLPQNVIPEVPFGTIVTMASMIAAMFGFIAYKRFR